MDLGQVLHQHAEWLEYLPRAKPYYAVKCNNDPMLLAILAHVGCSFDCASIVSLKIFKIPYALLKSASWVCDHKLRFEFPPSGAILKKQVMNT